MYLLDTPVILELRKAKYGQADKALTTWAASVTRQCLFISAITLLELGGAAARLARKDKAAGLALRGWIDVQVTTAFKGRILPVDETIVTTLARMPPIETRNGLLAATAKQHSMILVTRNVASFRASRIKLLNPWGYLPDEDDGDGDWQLAVRTGTVWLRDLFVRA